MIPARIVAAFALSLCVSIPTFAKTILPDACGDGKTTFDVSVKLPDGPVGPPPEGKGRIVFIETFDHTPLMTGETTRFGVDGNWVGANRGDSYFVFDLAPGEHHLCANWQKKKDVGVLSLTVEAGKTYYYQAEIHKEQTHASGFAGGQPVTVHKVERGFEAGILTEDQGKFRVKASKLSTWK